MTNVAVNIDIQASDPRVKIVNHTGVFDNNLGAGQMATFDIEFVGDGVPHRFDLQFQVPHWHERRARFDPRRHWHADPGRRTMASKTWKKVKSRITRTSAAPTVATLLGDTNHDGHVNIVDLNNVRNDFGASGAGVTGDTNGDLVVNIVDL